MEKGMRFKLAGVYSQTKNYFNENKDDDSDLFLKAGSGEEVFLERYRYIL
jgi:hypothetical protein